MVLSDSGIVFGSKRKTKWSLEYARFVFCFSKSTNQQANEYANAETYSPCDTFLITLLVIARFGRLVYQTRQAY